MRTKAFLFCVLLLMAGTHVSAQGFRVYKSDGTYVTYSTKADSIVFFEGDGGEDSVHLTPIPPKVDNFKPIPWIVNEHTALITGVRGYDAFRTGAVDASWRLLINTTGNPTRETSDYSIRYDVSSAVFDSDIFNPDGYERDTILSPSGYLISSIRWKDRGNYCFYGLQPNTKYYLRGLLRLDNEDYYSDVVSFETKPTMDSCILHNDDLLWFRQVKDPRYNENRLYLTEYFKDTVIVLPSTKAIAECKEKYVNADSLERNVNYLELFICRQWLKYIKQTMDLPISRCSTTYRCSDGTIFLFDDADYLQRCLNSLNEKNCIFPLDEKEYYFHVEDWIGSFDKITCSDTLSPNGEYLVYRPSGATNPRAYYLFPYHISKGKKYKATIVFPIDAEGLKNDTIYKNKCTIYIGYPTDISLQEYARGNGLTMNLDAFEDSSGDVIRSGGVAKINKRWDFSFELSGKEVRQESIEFESSDFSPFLYFGIVSTPSVLEIRKGYIRNLRIASQIRIEEL